MMTNELVSKVGVSDGFCLSLVKCALKLVYDIFVKFVCGHFAYSFEL